MFSEQSRYAHIETGEHVTPDGRKVTYVRRRVVPPPERYIVATRLPVTDSDRLDLLAFRALGSALAYWQLADANAAVHPRDLLDETPGGIAVPVPMDPRMIR